MTVSLVTGGAGFIGSHVVRYLLARGDRVIVLDDLSGGYAENVPQEATFVRGSITDAGLVEKLFVEHRFDYVYHLAAYAAEGLSHFIRSFNYTNNVVGSMNIVNACVNHEVKCLVFTSSIAVYGANQVPMREDLVPAPEDPYGIAKYAVEQDLRSAHEMFGLDYVIFRPHNVYGEYQNTGDRYRNVIGIFMNRIMQGLTMPIFGDGTQTRAFSYVGDMVPAISDSVLNKAAFGEVFNVGADQEYTVNELATVVAEAMGVEPRVEFLDARKEVLHAFSDHTKAKSVFGEGTMTPLREGIQKMADWAKSVGPRESGRFGNIEVLKNLPPAWR